MAAETMGVRPSYAAPLPEHEPERVRALRSLKILDTDADSDLDDLCQLAAEICHTPTAIVSFVAEERQWFKAAFGTTRMELPRDAAFCAHTILAEDTFVVPDTTKDARTTANPLVAGAPHVRFYAGAKVRSPDGYAVGALCVVDHVARTLSPAQLRALRTLANQVEAHLALRAAKLQLERSDAALRLQRDAHVRSQGTQTQVLRKVLASTPTALFITDLDGRYVMSEGGALVPYGLRPGEVVGRSAHELYRELPEVCAVLDRALSGETIETTLRVGAQIYDVRLAPLTDDAGARIGAIGFAIDVTARARAQRRLALERQAGEILTFAPSLDDAAPQILAALCEGGGWSGAALWVSRDGEMVRATRVLDELALDVEPYAMQAWMTGSAAWHATSHGTVATFPVRTESETYAVVVLHVVRQRAEDAMELLTLGRLGVQLGEQIARRRAQDELRASGERRKLRDEMSALIVHDLKNPIAAVIGNLDFALATGQALSREVDESLHDALSAATRTLRLVNGLLTEVSLEAGQLRVNRTRVDVPSFLSAIVQPRRRLLDRQRIALETRIAPGVQIDADPDLLCRVVENLFDNASRHTPKDGRMLLSAEQHGEVVRIALANTGLPIPAEMCEHVFAKFGQASSHRQGRGNLGLGLYFCRTAIHAHAGVIRVESDEAWPVRFVVELPLASARALGAHAPPGER